MDNILIGNLVVKRRHISEYYWFVRCDDRTDGGYRADSPKGIEPANRIGIFGYNV